VPAVDHRTGVGGITKKRRTRGSNPDVGGRAHPSESVVSEEEHPEASSPATRPFPIVGVGASAGGLEAFGDLFRHLAPDTGMGFVLVQHLDPAHPSMLSSILSRSTRMRLREVTERTAVEPNHVYVIPPNANLALNRDVLELLPRSTGVGAHMPIDFFFGSLAENRGHLAIGVVLSGTASDGARGLAAIKEAGGVTFAQDPASAQYDGMPRAAIRTGCVDFVLRPEEISRPGRRRSAHR
jgi:two-component system, chemotaxis family, CheB/CheR fusion protein